MKTEYAEESKTLIEFFIEFIEFFPLVFNILCITLTFSPDFHFIVLHDFCYLYSKVMKTKTAEEFKSFIEFPSH